MNRCEQISCLLDYESSPFFLRDSRAIETRARVKITGLNSFSILGDPGADSGDEEKSKRAGKNMARSKVKNGEESPWGQCLTRPVPNGRRRSGF